MVFGTSNRKVLNTINDSNTQTFKTVNNLLTLQENHVEEFFQYHGLDFFGALEQLMSDVTERVVSQMLSKMELSLTASTGKITVSPDCLRDYEKITQENIDLDIQNLLNTSVNSEVIMQRKMAKSSYLESQGYSSPQPQMPQIPQQQPMNIQGQPQTGQMNMQMNQQMGAINNQSGYPVPPAGYDNMNNPYWMDPNTGQATYSPPSSGLGLSKAGPVVMKTAQKAAAWAKWLA
tara:strand:+ start:2763 stop:3461 length:699 start_codon:yes stop_codon:yes gene_type:complete